MKKLLIVGMMILTDIITINMKNENKISNPLLTEWKTVHQTPPFNEVKHEHFVPAIDQLLAEAKTEVDGVINNSEAPTFNNTIRALEVSGKKLSRATTILFNLNSAETDDTIQSIAREVSPKLSAYRNYVSLDEKLFQRVKAVYSQKGQLKLNPEDLKLLDDSYKGFVRSGANLEGAAKARFAEINTELSKLSLKFGENVLAETNSYQLMVTDKKDLSGLPEGEIEAAAQLAKGKKRDGWMFNLQGPSYNAFMRFADNRKLREEIYKAYSSKGYHQNSNNNEEIVKEIVNLRLERAKLLGYPNHAAFVLEERMAESTAKVNAFLEQLHEASRPGALQDLADVKAFATSNGFKDQLERWDWSYWSEKLKNERYGFDEQAVKPYFKLENVIGGVFELANRLYGITFQENRAIQVYHTDVKAYEVYDKDGSFLSVLYLDFFPREGKRGGAWMTEYRSQSKLDGRNVRPIVSIVANFTKPTDTKPSLLTFNEVSIFLHEFGHGLHGIFANTVYEGMSGTSVYRDFVELPSQIMENWAIEKDFLDIFASNYQTGEKIPSELVQKLIKSKNFLAGAQSERQLSFGMNDMAWHSITEPVTGSVVEFEKIALIPTDLFPPMEGSCLSTSFSHIFSGGYAAGYYGYKWAQVLDADAFSLFKTKGIFDTATAESFRKNILEKGGTAHPMVLYKAFRGQEPSITPLLEREGLLKKVKD
ncbi:MAG: M3 family metallopeptidase [Prolixibacteraceae bacterium]|jgi:peptidyl-dipeptidase Dcp|nr:M3 family metallopeptidase [Prolixibacteraceae bacterium]